MKFLIIFLLIIFITPYIIRLISPFLLKFFIRKVEKKMNQQYQAPSQNSDPNNNFQSAPKDNKTKDELGDYVEFEEIPDQK